ncbi:MAG: hypothetical protein RL011_1634 [Pseudomonadota bacterium]
MQGGNDMPGQKQLATKENNQEDTSGGQAALSSYSRILDFIADGSRDGKSNVPADLDLPFIRDTVGLRNLLLSMCAVAPATPDTSDEEWNPLSQRPNALLPAAYIDELGGEITALKTAVDEFTILSHELMHVALWEPFFAGYWHPRSKASFREFSLKAEGFCYFFGDIVVSGAIRIRLPDGEFALDRQSASNARFHPVRAFKAAGISNHREILDIYLEGFSGKPTPLWQPRGKNDYAAALAAQAYDFYKGTLGYLTNMHTALEAFGCLSEFFRRYCSIPGLPSFLLQSQAPQPGSGDLNNYFAAFFHSALSRLEQLTQADVTKIRWRRMLQMRAYYAMQVRWLISENYLTTEKPMAKSTRQQIMAEIRAYLDGIENLLHRAADQDDFSPARQLEALDARYSARVRSEFLRLGAWVGVRWLIAPSRAGGSINLVRTASPNDIEAKRHISKTVTFLVEELTARLVDSKNAKMKTTLLTLIKAISEIGAKAGQGSGAEIRTAERALRRELARKEILELWSLPVASFDPRRNRYRELVFSYQ